MRLMVTGASPISGDVLDFLKICFCCDLVEGYGMSETGAASSIVTPGDKQVGRVGGPVWNCKIKLRDIPEMNAFHTNDPPKGEICFCGGSIMKGYYKNPEKTAEAMRGPWLLSGDVGIIHPNGSI